MRTTIKTAALSAAMLLLSAAYALSAPMAVFNYKIFYIPEKGPVIETYLDFSGRSIAILPNENGEGTGLVELILMFKQDENIISWDKKLIETPVMSATDRVDFIDVQRFSLPPGSYMLEIQFKDVNELEGMLTVQEVEIVIPEPVTTLFFSDIQLVSAFKKAEEIGPYTKSGYDMLPMVSDDYASASMNELVVYGELYNSVSQLGQDAVFAISTVIEDATTGIPIGSTQKYERKKAAAVAPFFTRIDIADVEAGDYLIAVEARDRENKTIARKTHQIRRNHVGTPSDYKKINSDVVEASWVNLYTSKQELYEYVQALRPISGANELFVLDNTFSDPTKAELSHLQQFFYAYWDEKKPGDGESAWLEYREKLAFVEKEFGTRNKRGYNTDRGRIWLQYGAPDDITDRPNEPSSYPYQIWRYYKAGQWNNVRFVFYDTTLLAEDYELLHSDNIPGELKNPQWQLLLEQRNTPMNNVDMQQGREHLGGRVDMLFENPR